MEDQLGEPPTPMSEATQQNADANTITSISQATEKLNGIADLHFAYSTPERMKDNEYDNLVLSRDQILGNIPAKDFLFYDALMDLYLTMIQDWQYAGYYDMAKVYRSELMGLIDRLRSRDGFERIQQNSANVTLNKNRQQNHGGQTSVFNQQ